MKYQGWHLILVSLMLVLATLPLAFSACWATPIAVLRVENQTDQVLTIFIDVINFKNEKHRVSLAEFSDVAPGAKVKDDFPDIYRFFVI